MHPYSYIIERSPRRKRLSITVRRDKTVVVKIPSRVSDREAERFLMKYDSWVRQQLASMPDYAPAEKMTESEREALKQRALPVFRERVAYYAPKVGVTYGNITIRTQKGRWGSCTRTGNLNFNALLLLAPPEVLDSVVVHELCHRKHMDHSAAFYREVYRVYPEYERHHAWLKKNGSALIRKLPGTL